MMDGETINDFRVMKVCIILYNVKSTETAARDHRYKKKQIEN